MPHRHAESRVIHLRYRGWLPAGLSLSDKDKKGALRFMNDVIELQPARSRPTGRMIIMLVAVAVALSSVVVSLGTS